MAKRRSRKRRRRNANGRDKPEMKIESGENDTVSSDELDNLPLFKRRQLLLSERSKPPPPPPPGYDCRDDGGSVAEQPVPTRQSNTVVRKKGDQIDCQAVKLENGVNNGDFDELDHMILKKRMRLLLPREIKQPKSSLVDSTFELKPCDKKEDLPLNTHSESCSTLLNLVQVKAEPLETSEVDSDTRAAPSFSLSDLLVKEEYENPEEPVEDDLDSMTLKRRIELQKIFKSKSDTLCPVSNIFVRKDVPSTGKSQHTTPDTFEPTGIKLSRKRKKTATDSIETALEEDAPGLLQILVEQGVLVDEIKLYGKPESDEPIDESFTEDSFSELESLISKLFFKRDSFLKFPAVRGTKFSKASYCVTCLFSLVEQTRYLQFRKWPAEWGWCRDLEAFIFVFRNHKRIVLERPEYGYATYFFELLDPLPVDWQINRLIIAMKVTNCGRSSLIENKPLLIGEDLSEGEAKVLMEYGWIPNTGIGTMLNYCDRVYHDSKNERDAPEWRTKICKLLMDGYSRGTDVTATQTNDVGCKSVENSEIKMELG